MMSIKPAEKPFALKAQRALAIAKKDDNKFGDALKKAEQSAAAPITDKDAFTPFTGATWAATRFLDSTKDDPAITFPSQSTGRRTALADWITDRRNPLTARVAVNHLWTRHLGKPLVPSVFDFGRKGAPPTHPKLLDWLAAELMENDWSMKHLHRLIVTSAVYRLRSSTTEATAQTAIDPDNHYWWRREGIRIESQAVRDSILALAGTLDPSMGGPPVPKEDQATSQRRSLYLFHSNNDRNLFLTMFDEATVTDCYRRDQSIVPQQALALTNSKLVLDAAPKIVSTLKNGVELSDEAFIRKAFTTLLGITPNAREVSSSLQALVDWQSQPDTTVANARAHLVWALINHNDFVTIR